MFVGRAGAQRLEPLAHHSCPKDCCKRCHTKTRGIFSYTCRVRSRWPCRRQNERRFARSCSSAGPVLSASNRWHITHARRTVASDATRRRAGSFPIPVEFEAGGLAGGKMSDVLRDHVRRQGRCSAPRTAGTSLMPEGLLQAMPHEDARDLFLYLSSSKQVALPEAK